MKLRLLVLLIVGALSIQSQSQARLEKNSILQQTSLGRAVLQMAQMKDADFNALFDALDEMGKSLETSINDEKEQFNGFSQLINTDLAFYQELVKQYSDEVSQYQIDARDVLKVRQQYEAELNNKRTELGETKQQAANQQSNINKDEKNYISEINELQSAINVLDDGLKLLDSLKYSSFIQKDELIVIEHRLQDNKHTRLLQLSKFDFKDAQTLKQVTTLLQDIRNQFAEQVLSQKSQFDAQQTISQELLEQYQAKVDQLSKEVIPQLQADIKTKDSELKSKNDLLSEAQANLLAAQERTKELNSDVNSATSSHNTLLQQYNIQLETITQCIAALNENNIRRS